MKRKLKIKADKEKFDEIKNLTHILNICLPDIVQNDIEMSLEELDEFLDTYNEKIAELDNLIFGIYDSILDKNTKT